MKPADDLEKVIKKDLNFTAGDKLHDRMLNDVLNAQEDSRKANSAVARPNLGRTIMKSPITKLAAAAVIIAVVILGLFEFLKTESNAGVVWADVVKKVQASQGLIYRESHPNKPDEAAYIMFYDTPTHGRMDLYQQGQIVRSVYNDYDARDFLVIHYKDRCYYHHPMDNRDIQDHQRQMHLKDWVEDVLSRPHTNLGRRTIGGVLCEGIETKYPIFGDMNSPVENSVRRVWVSVETGYPLLCEGGLLGDDGNLQVETILDQFQWDVELDASEFKPNIPADYEQM